MSWEQLVQIFREQDEEACDEYLNPPVACPNDGQPLSEDEDGVLHCNFDGWTWTNIYDPR